MPKATPLPRGTTPRQVRTPRSLKASSGKADTSSMKPVIPLALAVALLLIPLLSSADPNNGGVPSVLASAPLSKGKKEVKAQRRRRLFCLSPSECPAPPEVPQGDPPSAHITPFVDNTQATGGSDRNVAYARDSALNMFGD